MNGQKSSFIRAVVGPIMLLLLFGMAQSGSAQIQMLLKDIFPGPGNSTLVGHRFRDLNGVGFFPATDGINGSELWKTDGTVNGTVMIKDINPGAASSNAGAGWYIEKDGFFYTAADDGIHGKEFWKTDGTVAGTVLVKDIWQGPMGSLGTADYAVVNETMFFPADSAGYSTELWKSDGTTAGTVLVKDINPTGRSMQPGFFGGHLTSLNGLLFFIADDGTHGYELWKSDGTVSGTVMVKNIRTEPNRGTETTQLVPMNNELFFEAFEDVTGRELWKSDGTTAGTMLVKDINPNGSALSFSRGPEYMLNVNGTLFFAANDGGALGAELWRSDGTTNGTVLVKDINPFFTLSSNIEYLTDVNGTLFFSANDGLTGNELWKSDGTEAGTVLVKDIKPGSSSSDIREMTNVNGTLYFIAEDGVSGEQIWKSDGTTAGTVRVGGGTNPAFLSVFEGTVYYTPEDSTVGREPWALKSPIELTLEPVDPPIVIPPTGGSFQFDVTLANISGALQNTQFYTVVTSPGGETTDALFGPVDLDLASGQTIMQSLTQNVPAVGQGTFTYTANVTTAQGSLLASDSFTFTVTNDPGLTNASQSKSTGDWSVYETGIQLHAVTNTLPEGFTLEQNYPNPFNPTTTISYQLPQAERVKITIYDLTGRVVTELINEIQNAGSHQVQWDGTNGHHQKVASGLYLYRIQAGKFVQTRKMALIK